MSLAAESAFWKLGMCSWTCFTLFKAYKISSFSACLRMCTQKRHTHIPPAHLNFKGQDTHLAFASSRFSECSAVATAVPDRVAFVS